MRAADGQAEAAQPAAASESGGPTSGLLLGVIAVIGTFIFDGCGTSRAASYFDHYDGSAGYSRTTLVGRVRSIEDPPPSLWRNLYYGSKLREQKVVRLDVLQSEVPPQDVEVLFVSSELLTGLATERLYCFHTTHVGNYFSFLFRSRYGFQAHSVHEFVEKESPELVPNPRWTLPYKLYAVCSILLPLLFVMAGARIVGADSGGGSQRQLRRRLLGSIPLVLLFVAASGYITWLDRIEHIWPVGKGMLLALLIGLFVWVWRIQPGAQKAA